MFVFQRFNHYICRNTCIKFGHKVKEELAQKKVNIDNILGSIKKSEAY